MGMHKDKTIEAEELRKLEELMQSAEKASDLKRIQSVYFRAVGFCAEEVGKMVGYSAGHVKSIWTIYFKEGIDGLAIKPRGGRRRYNLTIEEERELLEKYTQKGEHGTILEIGPLYRGLCEKMGRKVGVASAYRLAKRHGWRKIAPRPEHPSKKPKAAQYFKIFFPEADRGS